MTFSWKERIPPCLFQLEKSGAIRGVAREYGPPEITLHGPPWSASANKSQGLKLCIKSNVKMIQTIPLDLSNDL